MKLGQLIAAHGSAERHGIDRVIRNAETGRFERSLSALTADGVLVTATEIYLEHDSASLGNKMTWVPVASATIAANGLKETYLRARGIAQKPGSWRSAQGRANPALTIRAVAAQAADHLADRAS